MFERVVVAGAAPARLGTSIARPSCRSIGCTTASCSIRTTRRIREPQRGHA